MDFDILFNSLNKDEKILIVEEGHVPYGIGDTIVSQLIQRGFKNQIKTIGAANTIIYAAKEMENAMLPDFDKLSKFILDWI